MKEQVQIVDFCILEVFASAGPIALVSLHEHKAHSKKK